MTYQKKLESVGLCTLLKLEDVIRERRER